jgi:hypothetical protein
MTRNAGTLLIVAMVLVSTGAWAGPLSLAMGETTFLGFTARSSKVQLSDESVVAVKTSRSGIELSAKRPGVTQVTLLLPQGQKYEFSVHVTPKGAHLYSTNRAEPEHSDFTFSPPAPKAKSQGYASKARKSAPASAPKAVKAPRPQA